MAEKRKNRLRICELNPHLLCALCGGYLIDATTIVECLHSFCKTCILRYLETSNYCPICEVLIHKKRPWQNIRLDHTLQNAVYKLVPGLFKREMQRRRAFYEKNPPPGDKEMEQVHVAPERIIFSEDEKFSVSLEFSPNGRAVQVENDKSTLITPHHDKRFLLCPANVCIGHLKKFVRLKNTLPDCCQIDLFYSDEPLEDTYTLMDVAYIYSWRRENVLTLYYSFYQRPRKRRRVTASATATSQGRDTSSAAGVIKAAKASTTSSSAAPGPTTTNTTSTVTIVEASDAGSNAEAEGTKTTVSVSLPASVSLSLSLPLSRPLPAAAAADSVNNSRQSISKVEFDDIDDDDDDERPLIIVTDTPSTSATLTDMAEGDSGVTIINHPKTLASKGAGGSHTADALVAKPPLLSESPTTVSDKNVVCPAPCGTRVTSIPTTQCYSSVSPCVTTSVYSAVVESSFAPETLANSTALPSAESVCTKEIPSLEKALSVSTSTASTEVQLPVLQNACTGGSQRQADVSNQREHPVVAEEQKISKQPLQVSSQSSQPLKSAPPAELCVHPHQSRLSSDSSSLAEAGRPSETPGQSEVLHCAEPSPPAEIQSHALSKGVADPPPVIIVPTPVESAVLPERPPEPVCSTDRVHETGSVHSSEVMPPSESPCSPEPSHSSDSLRPFESIPKTVSSAFSESQPSKQIPEQKSYPTDIAPSGNPVKVSQPTGCSKQAPQSVEPSTGTSLFPDQSRPKEASRPKEVSCHVQSPRPAVSPVKLQNNSQREGSKKETRPVSIAKVTPRETSSTGLNRTRSNSSMGIFERIYTVTSNCTDSGIKSIFKTTAIVPAALARRYSDVSDTSPAGGLGERRASTGGGGVSSKGLIVKDKSKPPALKQKTSPQRDNRSSMDALAHLAKNSVFSSPPSNKTASQKGNSPSAVSTTSCASRSAASSVPSNLSDKRLNANSTSGGSPKIDRPTSVSSCSNDSERNQVRFSSPVRAQEKSSKLSSVSAGGNKGADSPTVSVGGAASSTNGNKDKNLCSSSNKALCTAVSKSPVTSSPTDSKHSTKVSSALITGDLRVKLPKCNIPEACLTAAVSQLKQQQQQEQGSTAYMGSGKAAGGMSVINTQVSTASAVNKTKTVGVVKQQSTSGAKQGDVDKKHSAVTTAPSEKPSCKSAISPKHVPGQSNSQHSNAVKRETHSNVVVEKRAPISSSSTVTTSAGSNVSSAGSQKILDTKEKRQGVTTSAGSNHGPSKTAAPVNAATSKLIGKASSVKNEGIVSSVAGVKRSHSTVSTSSHSSSRAQCVSSSAVVRMQTGTKLVTSGVSKVTVVSAPQIRVPSVSGDYGGPEGKKPRLSSNSYFTTSPLITPTILSSSSAATGIHPAHRAGAVPGMKGVTSTTFSGATLSSGKSLVNSGLNSVSGLAKIRLPGNHTANSGKLLPPGQRVDSLLFRATNRLAAAASAARPVTPTSTPSVLPGQKRVRSESLDSRMSFINKTFGGGKSSKETCVNPAASRSEISFSARHILSPMYHAHSAGAGRSSSSAAASSSKSSCSVSMSGAKNSAGACDLTRKSAGSSSSKEGKGGKDGSANDNGSRSATESIKLDIPRLSTSSRDSVFTSDPECSPTPSPKYSDINRNPIKLEPGSKLCRKETWVSAENGGRRSTGSVGSPNSLGSGPGSPLETERSPARDARRPSDSEFLLSQRWPGLPPHPHLLTIPHPRDPATAAAVAAAAAALYNGHFKVPAAAKYLPLPPDHVPRSASPDPLPLDYSTTSSTSSK